MKLALISDTHGYCKGLSEQIKKQGVDYILHMGDGVHEAYQIRRETGLPTFVVKGNNDFTEDEKNDLFFVLEGIPIWMTHGHRYSVRYSRDSLLETALQKNAKIVLYGHTHVFNDEEIAGIRFINPGSTTLPRDGMASFAVLDLSSGELTRIELPKPKLFGLF
ncbi:MAG: metallophosphoesterase [Eubacteriales bacterium]|nr:metallophosphoesterase [Eubacteriales bacterium]